MNPQDPNHPPPDEHTGAAPSGIASRVLIGFVIVLGVSIVLALLLPRYGVAFPWWVPLVAFIPVVFAALAMYRDRQRDAGAGPIEDELKEEE